MRLYSSKHTTKSWALRQDIINPEDRSPQGSLYAWEASGGVFGTTREHSLDVSSGGAAELNKEGVTL
jgi:hypothetical protein